MFVISFVSQIGATAMVTMPEYGVAPAVLEDQLRELKHDDYAWRQGRVPVYVYHHTDELLCLSQQAYLEFFTENALGQGKAFPSVLTLEQEIVEMALDLLGGGPRNGGTFTSGGTESIFLAVKTARDRANIDRPKLVLPISGHATVNKAASYLGVEVVRTALGPDLRADVDALEAAIDDRTIMVVASAPGYPHGVFDPIEEIGALASSRDLWLHVDACVGGFLAPFVRDIGYPVPAFDLSVPGVSSLSADIHKYGFAAKGASVLLLADRADKRHQRFEFDDWPRGSYVTETFQGSRSAGPLASSWTVMRALGRAGYREIAKVIMNTKQELASGIDSIDGLRVIHPHDLCILLFGATDVDIYAVADRMVDKGWFVGRSMTPKAIHIALNPLIAPAIDEYLADLAACVSQVRATGVRGTINAHTY